jgi:predicted N-acetyltransferase YhbS
MVMTAVAPLPAPAATVGLNRVIGELRLSSRRRADRVDDVVDERGLVGVLRGPAPVLWATPWVSATLVSELAAGADELHELYVDSRRVDVVDELVARDWLVWGAEDQVVLDRAPEPRAEPAGYRIEETVDPAVMPRIRDLMRASFGIAEAIVEASYPDDFFLCAAPARMVVARDDAGTVVACVGRRRQSASAMLFGLSVDVRHRGVGLGEVLTRAAARAALADGVSFVHATVDGQAARIAGGCGFRPVATWIHLIR